MKVIIIYVIGDIFDSPIYQICLYSKSRELNLYQGYIFLFSKCQSNLTCSHISSYGSNYID